MKVLLINYEFPPLGSGAANATRHVAREMQRRGHAVTVLTSGFRGLPKRETLDGVEVRRLRVPRRRPDRCPPGELLAFALAAIPAALRLAAERRPDVCLAFFGFPCGPAAWALKRLRGVPYCVSLRNADVPRPGVQENRLLQRPLRWLVRRVWREADVVSAVSEGLAEAASRLAPGLSCRVVPNGVDTSLFSPAPERNARTEGPVRLLYVGRLRRFKGLLELLDAVAEVIHTRGIPCRLDIAGSGPMERLLRRRVAERALRRHVRFLGRVSHETMPELYRAADLFVFPSHAEGMSNALLEAMASGLAVVATAVEGSRELIRDGVEGLLVPPGDTRRLEEAIALLAADPSRRRTFGRNARKRVEALSWPAVAEMYQELLEPLAQ